ncbi:MAG: zinc ribbon domain-containing protein [Chloroflexi bacterium]|nr:MAG: zinc ribbon domain-containing protein [Chloroflexota bacterium]
MALIQFVRNYDDLSTDRGFQFKFYCDRCGNGYETAFQANATAGISDMLDTASSIFGGLFNAAASVGQHAKSAAYQQAKDAAFQRAIAEVKPNFQQCKRCGKWVDDVCWNHERGLCKDDAPDLDTEYSVAQSEAAIEQAREVAKTASYVTPERFKETIVATCANCGAELHGAKFCPECGTPVKRETKCKNCGADTKGAKFCPECGTKQ